MKNFHRRIARLIETLEFFGDQCIGKAEEIQPPKRTKKEQKQSAPPSRAINMLAEYGDD